MERPASGPERLDLQTSKIEMSFNAAYEPKPDITAYELACLIPFLIGQPMTEVGWFAIGSAVRHLRRT